MSRVIAVIGMVAVLALGSALDRLLEMGQQTLSRSLAPADVSTLMWSHVVADIVLAAAVLLLAWYAILKSPKSLLVSITFVVVGLGLLVSITPAGLAVWVQLPPVISSLSASTSMLLLEASAFVAVIGILSLGVRRRV